MEAIAGVAAVKFDCKTATVTARPGATLVEAQLRAAIEQLGWKTGEFHASEPPTRAAVRGRLQSSTPARELDAAALERARPLLERALGKEASAPAPAAPAPPRAPGAIDAALHLELAADGSFVALLPEGAAAPELAALTAQLRDALEPATLAAADVALARWPRTVSAARATLRGAQDAAALEAARAAIAGIENVLAVLPRADRRSFTVLTREPCEALPARVAAALASLAPRAIEVESVGGVE